MPTGGMHPAPWRTGGSSGSLIETLTRSLLDARGSAYDDGSGSFVYAEATAYARAIGAAWSTTKRLANQFDPDRMTDFLPRWEVILGLHPHYGDADSTRRTAVGAKMRLWTQWGNGQGTRDLLAAICPNTYTSIVHTAQSAAAIHITAGATIPGGITVAAEPGTSTLTWTSSTSHIAVEMVKPSWMSESDFYREADGMYRFLDDFLPAWTTFDWFRDGGGGVGFFLDDAHNLGNERFS